MSGRLKVMTVVGTRPEIIRLSRIIARLEDTCDHILVHTGQNYDYALNEIFFDDLGLRAPDHFLNAATSSLGAVLGDVLRGVERVLIEERPDAMVVLGDTNSCIAGIMARRLKVPVYHLEAGNRSFDLNVPEEINRRMIDHTADYNLVYSENSRRNLLDEGLHPSRVLLMGSPMQEVLAHNADEIETSDVLSRLSLLPGQFVVASVHREENVDRVDRLEAVIESLMAVASYLQLPVIVSTHPRTRARLESFRLETGADIRLHPPLGFHDFVHLQTNARCVISDSGTVAEESSILGYPAVTLRDAIERPEAIEAGSIITTGLIAADVVDAVRVTLEQRDNEGAPEMPDVYRITDSSRRVVNWIRSTASSHNARNGIRQNDVLVGSRYTDDSGERS